jgi:hypothetical protein
MFDNSSSETIYFDSSRIIFNNPNEYYKKYIDEMITNFDNTVYIDIFGTGKSVNNFFMKEYSKLPNIFYLAKGNNQYSNIDSIIDSFPNDILEYLNYDVIGSLINYDNTGPIRKLNEFKQEQLKPYHDCVELFVSELNNSANKIFTDYTFYNLKQYISTLVYNLASISIARNYFNHEAEH